MTETQIRNVTIFESCLVKHWEDLDQTEMSVLTALFKNEKIDFLEVQPHINCEIWCEEKVDIDIEYDYQPYERQTYDYPGHDEQITIEDVKVTRCDTIFSYWLSFGFRYFMDEFIEIYKYDFEKIMEKISQNENENE